MKYSDSHEWVRLEGNRGVVGISSHAQKELGEIVFVQLPKVGTQVQAGDEIAILESTKAATDIYTPISGRIIKVNEDLKENLYSLNRFPESNGWLFEIELHDLKEFDNLLDLKSYQVLCHQK